MEIAMAEKKFDEFLLDKRVSQRHINDGRIDREELEKNIESLPDLADQLDDISQLVFGDDGKPKVALSGDFVDEEQ
jgi:hypothetical protein